MKNYKNAISVAKRENNPKREFLLLNTLQGKHVPSKPIETFEMFNALAENVKNNLSNYSDFVAIGFAETATAIGLSVGQFLNIPTMQTTRENIENVEYLFFSEEHSHATEQKIIKNDLDLLLEKGVRGILFLEDELTTGNTIINGINIIRNTYKDLNINFAVASIINCMEDEHFKRFKDNNVECFYCAKYEAKSNIDGIKNIVGKADENYEVISDIKAIEDIKISKFEKAYNLRRQFAYLDLKNMSEEFVNDFSEDTSLNDNENKKILVLGTEEFMYIGLLFAKKLEDLGNETYFHATTRSPMLPSDDKNYIIKNRQKLRSVYDENRTTFIYNLQKYDEVFIVTDTNNTSESNKGLTDLISALKNFGNENIKIMEWSNSGQYEK